MSQLEKSRATKKHEGDGTTTGLGLWVRGHRLNAHTRERDKAGMDSVKTIMKAGKGETATGGTDFQKQTHRQTMKSRKRKHRRHRKRGKPSRNTKDR